MTALLAMAARSAGAIAPPQLSAASQAPIAIAIDADPAGNGPRTVASVESCISLQTGSSAEVDIALPPPGVPGDQGIQGWEFTLDYDQQILSIAAQNPNMLLVQASGSQLITAFSDQLPNDTGEYLSVAIDFGKRGIEPLGSSEVGSGVISRLTLRGKAPGVSPLVMRKVTL